METFASLVLALWVFFVATAIGRVLTRVLGVAHFDEEYHCTLSGAIGFGFVSHLMFLIGVIGAYRSMVTWVLLLCSTFGLRQHFIHIFHHQKLLFGEWWNQRGLEKMGGVAIIFFLIVALFAACVPPFGGDTTIYHYVIPKLYAQAGRLFFYPSNVFNMPQSVEMLYLVGLHLYKEQVGLLMNGLLGLLSVQAMYIYGKRVADRQVGLLAALLFISIPLDVWYSIITGKVDIGLLLYATFTLYAMVEWKATMQPRYLLLCGMLAGFAVSTKYIGLYVMLASTAIVMWCCLREMIRGRQAPSLRSLAMFVAAMLITGAPWYLKNWVLAGNPVWPVFYPLFGGKSYYYANYFVNRYAGFIVNSQMARSVLGWLTGPMTIQFHEPEFFGRGGIGPVFWGFLPIAILWRHIRSCHGMILMFAAVYYTIWFQFVHECRYLLPAIVALCLPISHCLISLTRRSCSVVRVASFGMVVIWVLISSGALADRAWHFAPYILGVKSRSAFLSRYTEYYDDFQWINKNLPEDALLYVFGDNETYYLDRKFVFDGEGFTDYASTRTVEQLAERLNALHVTHVLLIEKGARDPSMSSIVGFIMGGPGRPFLVRQLVAQYGTRLYSNSSAVAIQSVLLEKTFPCLVEVYKLSYPDHFHSMAQTK